MTCYLVRTLLVLLLLGVAWLGLVVALATPPLSGGTLVGCSLIVTGGWLAALVVRR
jgi:hypothetical protein